MEKLIIAGREFNSRLFLGTGKFNNNELMATTTMNLWQRLSMHQSQRWLQLP